MGSALVVGDIGAGLSTFVGLLYTAELRLGTQVEDRFRFSAERETIRQLEDIYGELVAGRFPERDVNWEAHPVSFTLGFRGGRLARVGRGGAERDQGFDTVRVQVGGVSAQEISELAERDAILEESTRRLLRSPVVLPLIDASRLENDPEDATHRILARYDRLLATTLEVVGRFLAAEPDRRSRTMHPLFVVTKFDRCPPATRSALGVPDGDSATWSADARTQLGERILARFFPRTAASLAAGSTRGKLRVARPKWYFSSLEVTSGPQGPRVVRRSLAPFGGWEPVYPFEEYRALIEELAELAHRLPGPDIGE